MMRTLLFILLGCFPLLASAGVTFSQLASVSSTPEQLSGRFVQTRYLSALDADLVSEGVFNYQRDGFIRWQIRQPIESELLMTPQTIINRQDGQELLRLESDKSPVVALLSSIFFSVMTAEWEVLENYFLLSGDIQGQQWYADLLPKDSSVLQVVSRIELKGDTLLREVILHEKSGDRTTIQFQQLLNDQ